MTIEENKALYRRFLEEIVNQGNLEAIEEFIASEYVNYTFSGMPGMRGPEGMQQLLSSFRTAFPDLRVTPVQVLADVGGDTVIGRGWWEGTHRGTFWGFPPNFARVKVSYIDIWRLEDGKFVESWVQMDAMGLVQQLGEFSPPPLA